MSGVKIRVREKTYTREYEPRMVLIHNKTYNSARTLFHRP